MNINAITLTDPPEIVKLKCEFRELCLEEEMLTARIEGVRNRKFDLAHEIFNSAEIVNRKPRHRMSG